MSSPFGPGHLSEQQFVAVAEHATKSIFLPWREELHRSGNANARPQKVPYHARAQGTEKGNSTDPQTWGTLSQAIKRAKELLGDGKAGGIGVVLGPHVDERGTYLAGLDLDSCRHPDTRALAPWAQAIIKRLNAYAEVSPSGTGVKLLFLLPSIDAAKLLAEIGEGRHGKSWKSGAGAHPPAIELFLAKRWFALTGEHLRGTATTPAAVPVAPLLSIVRQQWPEGGPKPLITVEGDADDIIDDLPHSRDVSRSGDAFRLAYRIARDGDSEEDFRQALEADDVLAAWANEKGERQVERAWLNGSAPARAERLAENMARSGSAEDEFRAALQADSGLATWAAQRAEKVEDLWRRAASKVATTRESTARLSIYLTRDAEPASGDAYIIKRLLARGDFAGIWGEPGSGKSAFAPMMAVAISWGEPFYGSRTRAAPVFYAASEDEHRLNMRLKAAADWLGLRDNVWTLGGLNDLFSPKSDQLEWLLARIAEHQPGIVFVDTVSAAGAASLDENNSVEMGRVVTACRRITDTGTALVLIGHTAKHDGRGTPRGHSILNGALDVSIHVQTMQPGPPLVSHAKATKNRSGPSGIVMPFEVRSVECGTDEDGDSITTPVAEPLTEVGAPEAKRPTTAKGRAFVVIRQAIDDAPGRSITRQAAASVCDEAGISGAKDKDGRRRVIARLIGELVEAGELRAEDDMLMLPGTVTDSDADAMLGDEEP